MALPTIRTSLVAMTLVVVLGGTAPAQDTTLSDQDAPATFGQTPLGRMVHGLNPANWRRPKMPSINQVMPTMEEKKRITKRKNSLVTEVSQTASKSWNKTKEILNPKRLLPSTVFGGTDRTPEQPDKKVRQVGFFESLLRPMPPKQQTNTSVNDFLKQQKPITQSK